MPDSLCGDILEITYMQRKSPNLMIFGSGIGHKFQESCEGVDNLPKVDLLDIC